MPVFRILLTMAFAFLGYVNGKDGPCKEYGFGCCPHTKWDYTEEMCVHCKPGYYWINCSNTCPYPAFGHECIQKCLCKEEFCDFMNGCTEDIIRNHEQKSTNCNKNINSTPNIKFIMLMVLVSVFVVILMTYIAVLIIEKHLKINGDQEHRNQ